MADASQQFTLSKPATKKPTKARVVIEQGDDGKWNVEITPRSDRPLMQQEINVMERTLTVAWKQHRQTRYWTERDRIEVAARAEAERKAEEKEPLNA